ncbi:UBP1-associated proteins 1C isoform X2 [Ziziphus jujuba]|uniref:UBP1-associated proteins 1C isoform X2 n=1 Tax=Ziziphus jujuba TaxID=326968 RepID=A0ABM3ITL2_ZIZJJ|nr:UBP1-associated proteins 1C isoform X2 [Ziziphus jujuba]
MSKWFYYFSLCISLFIIPFVWSCNGNTVFKRNSSSFSKIHIGTEKYGPKGEGKPLNSANAKPKTDSKQQPGVDLNVGLSERPPWFCSLCNTKATSKQTLLLHAEGKKHKAKARAIHAAQQQPKQTEESAPDTKLPSDNPLKGELLDNKGLEEPKSQDPSNVDAGCNTFEAENGNLPSKKKRKSDEGVSSRKKVKNDTLAELGNGEVIQTEADEMPEPASAGEKFKKIKWKKLITSALKSNPKGVLKMKKLQKLVLKALQDSGITGDECQFSSMLEHKINSSSRFNVDNKYVRLVTED